MTPKASINDLISTSASSGRGVVSDFVKMLANYASSTAKGIKDAGNDPSNPIVKLSNSMADYGDKVNKGVLPNPINDTAAGAGYMAAGPFATADPNPSQQRGINTIQDFTFGMPNLESAAAVPVDMVATAGVNAVKGGVKKAEQAVMDAAGAYKAMTPLERQAGFIKPSEFLPSAGEKGLPSIENALLDARGNPIKTPETPTNFGSYIVDKRGNLQPNPDPKLPLRSPAPAEYTKEAMAPQSSASLVEAKPVVPNIPKEKPFPDVPDQPRVVTDRVGTHPATGGNPVWLDFSDQAKKNHFYLEDQKRAQEVLNSHVAGDTALEVQENLPRQLQEESQRIKNIIANNPQGLTAENSLPVTRQSLASENAIEMQKAGITPGNSAKADEATTELLKELDSQLNAGKGNLTPNENIDGNMLQDYIKLLDKRLQSVYTKLDNGTTLTPAENATLTMRRTASNTLKARYPEAEAALDRQSAMMDASPYVAKYASQEMKSKTAAAEAAKNIKPPNIIQKAWSNPWIKYPLIAAGVTEGKTALHALGDVAGAGLGLAGAGINGLENIFQSNDSAVASQEKSKPSAHVSSIPQDAQGRYVLPENPSVTPLTPGTPEYTRAENGLSGNIRSFMNNAPQYMKTANTIQDDIKAGMPLDLMTKFKSSQDIKSYLSTPNQPYAKQLANIADLDAKFKGAYQQVNGTSPDSTQFLNPGDSAEQFQQKYDEIVKFFYDNYSQYQVPYLQTTAAPMTPNNNTSGTVQYQQPQQNTNISGMTQSPLLPMPGAMGLPPINSMPAQ